MKIELLNGQFNSKDALELITEMMNLKIKYHENRIVNSNNEEDIKFRELKIKNIQHQLYEIRNNMRGKNCDVTLNSVVNLEF